MADRDLIRILVREVVREALAASNLTATATEAESSPAAYFSPWTGTEFPAHPSQQEFNLTGSRPGNADLLELTESQTCLIESKRTCDHCGMCRRLGF
ncbi:MAG TPA: hypothetical protein VJ302_05430 [Blastocatellia bacterium]|nr:hypothetical protein [Blastocatellia bacterium]